ncbi:hypothetical protein [Gemella morbillorum]|jgi:hypothetical protein
MDFSGKIGAVKMPLFEALKKMIYNFMQNALVGGGKLKIYEIVSDQGVEKYIEQKKLIENVSDNKAMFAKDVLEDVLGYDTKQQNQKINVGTQNIENVKDKNETYIIEEEEEILR